MALGMNAQIVISLLFPMDNLEQEKIKNKKNSRFFFL